MSSKYERYSFIKDYTFEQCMNDEGHPLDVLSDIGVATIHHLPLSTWLVATFITWDGREPIL